MVQKSVLTVYANVEHDFPHQWHARVNFYWGEDWNRLRIRNINAPMVSSSIGTPPDLLAALLAPRPFAPNENILQYQNAGHLAGNLASMSLDQHSYKRFDLHLSYRHVNFKSDGGDALGSPQSRYLEDKNEIVIFDPRTLKIEDITAPTGRAELSSFIVFSKGKTLKVDLTGKLNDALPRTGNGSEGREGSKTQGVGWIARIVG